MTRRRIGAAVLCLVLVLCGVLSACGGSTEGFAGDGEPELSNPDYVRTPPPLLLAEYVGTTEFAKEKNGNTAVIDVTNVNKGYIAVKSTSVAESLVKITKTSGTAADVDDYYFESNGDLVFLPITRGSGSYTFQLLHRGEEQGDGNVLYYPFLDATAQVTLENEFSPFLVQNIFVNYNADSKCVAFSYELAKHASTDLEVVQQIYYWIANNVTYDTFKAQQISNRLIRAYLPDPDETLDTKTGICYDYASLAAAMLRANGIPTQLVKGDVKSNEAGTVYHAWNLVWTEETGWIAVKMPSSADDWVRVDLTFAAGRGSSMSQFIGDGENYTPLTIF